MCLCYTKHSTYIESCSRKHSTDTQYALDLVLSASNGIPTKGQISKKELTAMSAVSATSFRYRPLIYVRNLSIGTKCTFLILPYVFIYLITG